MGFPGGSDGKASACNAGDLVQSLAWEDPLGKEMATHFSMLAWRISWTEEPGSLEGNYLPKDPEHKWLGWNSSPGLSASIALDLFTRQSKQELPGIVQSPGFSPLPPTVQTRGTL